MSYGRQRFADQHELFEMSQLSNGASKPFIQSLLVGDENGVFSLGVVIFLLKKLKSANCSASSFDTENVLLFFKRKNAIGIILE